MKQAGYPPDRFFLMHIYNGYVKNGDLVPAEFFRLEDVTSLVMKNQDVTANKEVLLKDVLQSGQEPTRPIGEHCHSPFECDYKKHCWANIPENSVFDLYLARGKEWKLYQAGITALSQIPDDFDLNPRQQLQVRGAKYGEPYADIQSIRNFLEPLKGPLYFFDFETIQSAIPLLNGSRPFEKIPFQYSLHISDIEGNLITHKEFLANTEEFNTDHTDPRLSLIRQMKKDIADEGTILAYNASFEIGVLKNLAAHFEEERAFLEGLINRIVDLLVPFKNAWYYLPAMGGSASIKKVLPAIAPEFSYADLAINEGELASNTFLKMINGSLSGNDAEIREQLLKYCKRDTEGMLVIYRHLRGLI